MNQISKRVLVIGSSTGGPSAETATAGLPAGWPAFAERLASVGGEAHGPFGPAEVGGVRRGYVVW